MIFRPQSPVTRTFVAVSVYLMSDTWSNPSAYNHLGFCVDILIEKRIESSFRGATATAFLEWLTPSSLSTLTPYSSTLSVLLNEHGGIIDDTMITKHSEDAFYVVTNAGTRDKDLAWFRSKLAEWNAGEHSRAGPVEHEVLENWGLVALQGASCLFPLDSVSPMSAPHSWHPCRSTQVPRQHSTCRVSPHSTSRG